MASVAELMYEICREQEYGNYRLGGFYLSPEQLESIRAQLEPDIYLTHSCGLFRGIPVYQQESFPASPWQHETIRGIRFAYGLLDARRPFTIDLSLLDLEEQLRQFTSGPTTPAEPPPSSVNQPVERQ